MDWDKMSNFYRGTSTDVPIQFPFIWLSDFRGEDFLKSANQKQELPMAAMFVDGSGQNEQSLERTFQPGFDSCGPAVSAKKIFLEINQSETRVACDGHVC
jgi:hypothetical protein